MLTLIIMLRNFARFIEDQAEKLREYAQKKLRQAQEDNRKELEAAVRKQAQEWEREAKRHKEALERIQAQRDAATEKYDQTIQDIELKIKQTDLA